MLYRSTDCRSRRGAPMVDLAHNASFHSGEKIAPSKPGIKHLEQHGFTYAFTEAAYVIVLGPKLNQPVEGP